MDYKEAIRRIEDHQRVHHMKEQPRCQKITEALSLAIKALEQYGKLGGYVAEFHGLPIECHAPSPGDTIMLRYSSGVDCLDYVVAAFDSLKETFPQNKVLVFPKSMDIESMSNEEMRQFCIEQLHKLQEELPT